MSPSAKVVECGECHLCCIREGIPLKAHEDMSKYVTQVRPSDGMVFIAQKENGHCWYLTEMGCSIHDTAPETCKEFDCRELAVRHSYTSARKAVESNKISAQVLNRGRHLLGKKPLMLPIQIFRK